VTKRFFGRYPFVAQGINMKTRQLKMCVQQTMEITTFRILNHIQEKILFLHH